MQLIIYRIFMKSLDKKLSPPPKKKIPWFHAQCHFLEFYLDIHLRKQRKVKKQRAGGGGVEETVKGEIVNYILLKCYLKWTPSTKVTCVMWLKIFRVEFHFSYFRSCETTPLFLLLQHFNHLFMTRQIITQLFVLGFRQPGSISSSVLLDDAIPNAAKMTETRYVSVWINYAC